jgi:cytoskeletal protein CcmA (bactofilin family)
VRGEIVGADVLCVGPEASVEAHLSAEEIVVAGEVRGNLTARRRIELRSGARVQGSVRTARLVVAEGAVLDGSCRTGQGSAVDPGDPPETPPPA